MKILDLNSDWKVAVIHHKEADLNPTCKADIKCDFIEASVPGNVELDLQRAGLIDYDFYKGDGILRHRQLEYCHSFYSNEFYADNEIEDCEIVFEGIDTIADIYLNGIQIGSTENMFIEHRLYTDKIKQGRNELFVHIKPICLEARKLPFNVGISSMTYNYEAVLVRKAAHSFGWDISPRCVTSGIWKPVYIEKNEAPRIKEVYMIPSPVDKKTGNGAAHIRFNVDIGSDLCYDYKISVEGVCEDSKFYAETKLWYTAGKLGFPIENCKEWNVVGYGVPYMYDVTVKLWKSESVVDAYKIKYGHRCTALNNTEILKNDGTDRFEITVNDKRIFVLGTNWVAADIFHSKDKGRIEKIIDLIRECGCNTIRCWGGNVYENDLFYDLCDKYGIMVWQDFAMACGNYPVDNRMKDLIFEEASSVIKRLRQHPCICLWAGDNECDITQMRTRDPKLNVLTREVLPQAINQNDGTRPYIPSSPYISDEVYESKNYELSTEQHNWGPRDYFRGEYYKNINPCFASEIGYHGCPSTESVKKTVDEEFLWPPIDNEQWCIHCVSPHGDNGEFAYRTGLMTDQIKTLFGTSGDNLTDYSRMSQISQAEADKYFIESFRIKKGHTSGIIWWNIIDCWPQMSDAVVDYFFEKKLAYYYIKQSQQKICLMIGEKEEKLKLYAINDLLCEEKVSYTVTDADSGETVLEGKACLSEDCVIKLGDIDIPADNRFYIIKWNDNNGEYFNHYLHMTPPISYDWYKDCLKKYGMYSVEDIN